MVIAKSYDTSQYAVNAQNRAEYTTNHPYLGVVRTGYAFVYFIQAPPSR